MMRFMLFIFIALIFFIGVGVFVISNNAPGAAEMVSGNAVARNIKGMLCLNKEVCDYDVTFGAKADLVTINVVSSKDVISSDIKGLVVDEVSGYGGRVDIKIIFFSKKDGSESITVKGVN